MSFDYIAAAADALALLLDFGPPGQVPRVTLTHTPPGVYNRDTSKVEIGVPVITLGVGLTFDYGLHNSGDGTLGGSLIQAGDRQLLLAAIDEAAVEIPAPLKGDKAVALDGVEYTVENVKTLAPAGVAVLYDVQLRR